MAAFADLTAYRTAVAGPSELAVLFKTPGASKGASGRLNSSWTLAGVDGTPSAPSTAAAPDRTTTGALGQQNAGSGQLLCVAADFFALTTSSTAQNPHTLLLLCDRLSHQGGLSGTSVATQTTNLPTAALTRYTSGVGVMVALEIYGALGTTLRTATVSYTNTSSASGQIGKVPLGGNSAPGASTVAQMALMPLASGDTGVKSVESVTLDGSTGTAGNFGVTLFKPLVAFRVNATQERRGANLLDVGMIGGFPEIVDDACLWWCWSGGFNGTAAMHGTASFVEV